MGQDITNREFRYSVLMSLYQKETADNLKESLKSMVCQTVFPNEIVVVKDGILTEELEEVLNQYNELFPEVFVFVDRPSNGGLGLALRDGILACKNEWVARMDSDDIAVRTRIEEQIKVLSKHPEIDMIGSVYYEFVGSQENKVLRSSPEKHDDILKFMHKRNPFGHDTLIIRRSKVIEVGNYQSVFRFEDYDLWIRLCMHGAITYNIQTPLLYVRGNDDFYGRRGGLKYLKQNVSFFLTYKKQGFFSLKDCILSLVPRVLVCAIPNKVRTWIYINILRKSV